MPKDKDQPEPTGPRQLEGPFAVGKLLKVLLDVALAAAALLFVLFGSLIYLNRGTEATPDSTGKLLLDMAKYGPTVFPVLFAAIVGAALKTFATWRIQSGTRIGLIEQLVGSHTVAEAFFTQARLKAFNILGVFIVLLWCLSPLGSQAALRAISTEHTFRNGTGSLTVLETFVYFGFMNTSNLMLSAKTSLIPAAIASILSAQVLQGRNQDLWGNIRIPLIERLTESPSNTSWVDVSGVEELDYSSLVGVPVASLPSKGNRTFTISASYLNADCPTIKVLPGTLLGGVPLPDVNSTDKSNCRWVTRKPEHTLRVSLSQPCIEEADGLKKNYDEGKDRPARVLIWQSYIFGNEEQSCAECHLTTTYVDVKMHCQGTLCSPLSVRRSPKPPRHGNWTILDTGVNLQASSGFLDQGPEGFLEILANMFPGSNNSGGQVPTITYLVMPFNVFSTENKTQVAELPREVFETRLAHLMNSEVMLGIRPGDVAGGFTEENANNLSVNVVKTDTYARAEVVRYSGPWLAMLFASSTVLFGVALAAIVVRFRILVPDILGSLALGMLNNRCDKVMDSSFLSGGDKMAEMKEVKVMLGDVEPHAEIGRIALAVPMEDEVVGKVQKGKLYL